MIGRTSSVRGAAFLLVLCAPLVVAQDPDARDNHAPIDPGSLAGPAYYDAARFPAIARSVSHPDADLPAPVRALLMVDAHESELRHARYRVRYHLAPGDTAEATPVADVEILRLNMGPSVRDELIARDPNLPVGPPEAFGSGPHVAFRFAMGPMQGMQAAISRVERREISNAEAQALRCLDMPCLELVPGPGPGGDWQSIPAALPALPFANGGARNPAAAAVLAFLLDAVGEDATMPLPRGDAHRLEFVISQNTFGQDDASSGLARNSVVLDDEIGTLWVRWRAIGDGEPDASLLPVPHCAR